jgi:adenylylsulfate kinase
MHSTNFIYSRVIWFTGLSGSGKTTIALELKKRFDKLGIKSLVLDGDRLRKGLNKDLGYSIEDRFENIRRAAEIAKLLSEDEILVLASFISPTKEIRALAKKIIGGNHYKEIYLSTDLKVCESRDIKGLYKKARNAELNDFSGISSPYEIPECPDLEIDTGKLNLEQSVESVYDFIINLV